MRTTVNAPGATLQCGKSGNRCCQIEIFYCTMLEGARSKTGVGTALAHLLRDPEGAIA